MEMRRLLYFARIAEDGSLTKAAGVLRIAQPALSRQVRLLEAELGVALFQRTARGMRLTEEGEYLRAAATGPLRELELALQNVRAFSTRIEGDLAIGMPSSIGDILAKRLVLRMDSRFPNIKLRVVEGVSGSLVDWLNRGIIDFALIEDATQDERLTDHALLTEPLVLVGSADSDLDDARPIPFAEAARLPLVVQTHHLGIRGRLNDAAARTRTTLAIRFEADAERLIKELVATGIGYAVLPHSHVEQECRAGRLKRCGITQPALTLTTFLSFRTQNRATKSRFEEALIESLAGLVGA